MCVAALAACRPSAAATDGGGSEDASSSGEPSVDESSSDGATTDGGSSDSSASSDDTGDPVGCPSGGAPGAFTEPAEPGTLVLDPHAALPDELADVGIYPRAPDLSTVADVAFHYVPAWPLWSNGSDKHRYLVLPPDTAIDTSDPQAWRFPAGALLLKTFVYDDGPDGCPRPVETRLMRKKPSLGWDYAVYAWDEAGERATLLDIAEPVPIAVVGDEGPFEHHVPARIECRGCHESAWGEALGVELVQLSSLSPGSNRTPLDELSARGWTSDAIAPNPLVASDPAAQAVLGMFHGNCVHCHNASGGPSSSFDLRHEVALDNTVGQPTESSASASGIRIVPGSPEDSVLFAAFSGETDDPEVKPMPPMGVDVPDRAAIEALRAFIVALEER